MKLTISLIKADVGSIGGHTCPSRDMIRVCESILENAITRGIIIDGHVSYTGDDINLILSHENGPDNEQVHIDVALKAFQEATRVAKNKGLYGAGQDLLVDAPSGNIRGAGPAVAEIIFEHNPNTENTERPAESFMIFAADKCGPGAYNLPLYLAFADPIYCSGLMLNSKMQAGFSFTIIDMDETRYDSIIELNTPEDSYSIAALLRDNDRFAIDSITSRAYPDQTATAVSAQRLHHIAGAYTGKDDPIAIVRNQGIFPAPEEILHTFTLNHLVGGGARGSHTMPIMPVPARTAVTGPYCLPIVSALGFSVNEQGTFAEEHIDFFNNVAWDHIRIKAQEKALNIRQQGWSGPAMLPYTELEYGGIKQIIQNLQSQFRQRPKAIKNQPSEPSYKKSQPMEEPALPPPIP